MGWLSRSFCVAVAALVTAACGPSVALSPVEPEQVELYVENDPPSDEYKVIKRIEERVLEEGPDARYPARPVLLERARARAAELGADALIIEEIVLNQFDPLGRVTILRAVAVYFPSRHPELNRD
jgi:hypothetical protein